MNICYQRVSKYDYETTFSWNRGLDFLSSQDLELQHIGCKKLDFFLYFYKMFMPNEFMILIWYLWKAFWELCRMSFLSSAAPVVQSMVTRSKDLGEPLRWCLCITWSWARTITSSSPLSGPLHPEPREARAKRSQSQERPGNPVRRSGEREITSTCFCQDPTGWWNKS